MLVEADHVYLIPPKKEMIISGGRLLLSERDRQQELTLPIDVFFRSLAQDCGAARHRDRALGQRQRRLARHPRRPRGGRAGARPGHRERAVRRHAQDSAVDAGRRALRPRRRRRCRAVAASSTSRRRRSVAPSDGDAAATRRASSAVYRHARRTSSASTSRTTSRARSRAASSAACSSRAPTTSTSTCARLRARARRARRALSRSADRRDALLPRRAGVRASSKSRCCPSSCGASRATSRCASGSPAAPPARRPTRSPSCSHELMARQHGERPVKIFATDVHRGSLEHRRRARSTTTEALAERLARAPGPLLHRTATATRSCPSCAR